MVSFIIGRWCFLSKYLAYVLLVAPSASKLIAFTISDRNRFAFLLVCYVLLSDLLLVG